MSYRVFPRWVTCPKPNAAARARLFCFPFAGGGASVYRAWSSSAPEFLEVCPVQLPGREDRYSEPAYTNLTGLARAAARELAPFTDKPFAFFGHSMGAILAFEIARVLRSNGMAPAHLFLASYTAPHVPWSGKVMHLLSDEEFKDEIRRLAGTPEAVLNNPELMEFLLPVLRADFQSCDTYRHEPQSPLACPFQMFGGIDDANVGQADLEQWRRHTSGAFDIRMLPGNHFFIQSERDAVLKHIEAAL